MSTYEPSQSSSERSRSIWRVSIGSLVGTSLEFYDHFIYGAAAALVFPFLFFPEGNLVAATLLSLATYSVAFVTRPIGAVIFGHYGDRVSRKTVLVMTLLLMGGATFIIGLLPTYATIGVWAPILLVTLRICQGIGLGGEWGGAALMVSEFDPEGRHRGFFGSLVQVASPIGVLLGNGVFLLMTWLVSPEALLAWAWRVPFLTSAILIMVGLYIRLSIAESPVFEEVEESHTEARVPIFEVVRDYWREVLVAMGTRAGESIAWYIFSVYLLVYGTQELGMSRTTNLVAVLAGAVVGLFAIPLFGALSDRIGRRPVIIAGAVGALVWGFIFFPLVGTKIPVVVVLAAMVGMLFQAALWGPVAAFMPELFGTRVRMSGASVGLQLGGVLGGAFAPIIAVALVARFDSWVPVAIYLAVGLIFVIIAVFSTTESFRTDLRTSGKKVEEQ